MAHKEHWKQDPDPHDFPAAADYLSMLFPPEMVAGIVEELRKAPLSHRKAKDLLRASGLPLLRKKDPEVVRDFRRVDAGEQLSPVLLVRGNFTTGVLMTVADGYHRICASYHLSEDEDIPCRLADPDPKRSNRRVKPAP